MKQSGQPGSGAADSSSLSKSSSIFESTLDVHKQAAHILTQLFFKFSAVILFDVFSWSHQSVCIHEDTLWVMGEGPTVEFSEGDAQFGPLQQRQVGRVAAI